MDLMQALSAKTCYDPDTRIWSGAKFNATETNLGQAMLKALAKDPEHINQICADTDKKYTNREISSLSIRAALNLAKLGLKEGDVLGLCAANSDFIAPLYVGALLNGLPVNALDPSFDMDGIRHMYAITQPKIMFCDGAVYEKVKQALAAAQLSITIYTMTNHRAGVPNIKRLLSESANEAQFKYRQLKAETPAFLLCSSGTTGLPKAVTVAHGRILAHAWQLKPTDTWLCFSTAYWATGLVSLTSGTIAGITRIISEQGFSVQNMFNIISKYKVNHLMMPPSQMAMCAASADIKNYDLSSVKNLVSGGGASAPQLVTKLQQHMTNAKFYTGYGMSEVTTFISAGLICAQRWTGQLVSNIEVKLINEAGESLSPNHDGEICLRTPQKWYGYYRNPEATAQVYNAEGWHSSGDLGHFDDDGNLYVVDRKKDIMKYNNFHFSPSEIESVIMELPQVAEACVFGISDIVCGHLPAALIVTVPGSELHEQQVADYVAGKMAHFKQLRGGVFIRDSLPKTPSGKVLRRKALELCTVVDKDI